jgi:hypothetical protein
LRMNVWSAREESDCENVVGWMEGGKIELVDGDEAPVESVSVELLY